MKKWFNDKCPCYLPLSRTLLSLHHQENFHKVELCFAAFMDDHYRERRIKTIHTSRQIKHLCEDFIDQFRSGTLDAQADLYREEVNEIQRFKSTKSKSPHRRIKIPTHAVKTHRVRKYRDEEDREDLIASTLRLQRTLNNKFYGIPLTIEMNPATSRRFYTLESCDEKWLKTRYHELKKEQHAHIEEELSNEINCLEQETKELFGPKVEKLQKDILFFKENLLPKIAGFMEPDKWYYKRERTEENKTKVEEIIDRELPDIDPPSRVIYKEFAKLYFYSMTAKNKNDPDAILKRVEKKMCNFYIRNEDFPLNFPEYIRRYLSEYHREMTINCLFRKIEEAQYAD